MSRKDWKTLGCVLVIHLLMCLSLGPSKPSTDDLCYLQDAIKISDGTYSFNSSPKTQRLGMILPTYGLITVLGTHPLVISLYPMLCSILSIVMVFGLLRHSQPMAIIASMLLALNITQITYACALFPDVILSMIMFTVALIFHLRHDQHPWLAILAASMLIFGFFVKQLIVVMTPMILYWLVIDLIKRKNLRFQIIFFATLAIAIISIISVIYKHTGNWFFLVDSVENQHNRVFADLDTTSLIQRLTWQPLVFLFNLPGFWPLIVLSVPSIVQKTANTLILMVRNFLIYLLVIFWIGSTSLLNYSPLLLLDRMWLPLLIPLCLLAAHTTCQFSFERNKIIGTLIYAAFILSATMAMINGNEGEAVFYILIPTLLLLSKKLTSQKGQSNELSAVIITIPFILLAGWFILSNSVWIV